MSNGRRTRFEERVRVERNFLEPVNRVFGRAAPLAGMTAMAIDSWENRASSVFSETPIAGIAALLRQASKRAELLADNSRDVFEKDTGISGGGIETLSSMLSDLLEPICLDPPPKSN
ncbi:hypothetical protein GRI62_03715 [Erythrobacter arachoides]|uniref:Uncharacterized protein n=1 Tax=Aurantiacibacter arachoides TaxID=1850444 RepID=A0A844ZZ26_9SPHN|nr:hypothetical protein [Aurantiacibacter arachoides]MXO92714.1 hypothetical protein [Aurantiacibacter arachoides]GGD55059.1 hypothetical protein GCM10011411_13760 [Aurantiacibacter arachoides]